MKFHITHTTRYTYEKPVSLGPHVIRLHPRTDAGLLLQEYHCDIDPRPALSSYSLDPAGNRILQAQFGSPTQALTISTSFKATTSVAGSELPAIPAGVPVQYSQEEASHLAIYLQAAALEETGQSLLATLRTRSQGDLLRFLDQLNTYLHDNIHREIRDQGLPQTPEQTLMRRHGACRDVAVLFMALCRAQGLAARFVSGYQAHAESVHEERYLHAWPEVYLPGVGWRGYDPTHASRVQDAHIAVAASYHPAGAAPVEGSYYGEAVDTGLTFNVSIEVSE
jgi:transglutaminase-like putative cysteine protease